MKTFVVKFDHSQEEKPVNIECWVYMQIYSTLDIITGVVSDKQSKNIITVLPWMASHSFLVHSTDFGQNLPESTFSEIYSSDQSNYWIFLIPVIKPLLLVICSIHIFSWFYLGQTGEVTCWLYRRLFCQCSLLDWYPNRYHLWKWKVINENCNLYRKCERERKRKLWNISRNT